MIRSGHQSSHFVIAILVLASAVFMGFLTRAAFGEEAHGEEEPNPKRAVIHFADLGGIKDWRAVDRETLYVEGRNNRWFKVTFMGPCTGIMFTETIGFATDATGDLDKFSSIFVDGRQCHFRTFEAADDPPKKKKKKEN